MHVREILQQKLNHGLIDELTFLKANIQLTDLIKSIGEGSRGGIVIGHTRSGKAIYASRMPSHYEDFSSQDHVDAKEAHLEQAKRYQTKAAWSLSSDWAAYNSKSQKHKEMAERHGNKAYHTAPSSVSPNKSIYLQQV